MRITRSRLQTAFQSDRHALVSRLLLAPVDQCGCDTAALEIRVDGQVLEFPDFGNGGEVVGGFGVEVAEAVVIEGFVGAEEGRVRFCCAEAGAFED